VHAGAREVQGGSCAEALLPPGCSRGIASRSIAIPGGQLAAAAVRRPIRSKEAAVTVRRASLLGNSRRRPPSNGIDFAAAPSHAALELEQQDCWCSGLGKALLSNRRFEVQLPRRAHDLKQAQSFVVQHPKVGRAVVDDDVGLVALLLSPRWRRIVERPQNGSYKVGRGVVKVVVGLVALLLSPAPRHSTSQAGCGVTDSSSLGSLGCCSRRRRVVQRPKQAAASSKSSLG
jgi:hypothetical protein